MFHNKLKQLREEKGLTKAKLSRKSGVSQTYLGELEAGKKTPTIAILEKIAVALEISPTEFLKTQNQ